METKVINKAFSMDRFATLWRMDLALNRGNYIKHAIAVIGVFAALATLISINAVIDINGLRHSGNMSGSVLEGVVHTRQLSYGSMYLVLAGWLVCIGLTIFGSLTFCNFSSRRQRISSLMVPASRIEKFSQRFTVYFIAGTLLLVIGLFAGLAVCQIAFGGGAAPLNSVFKFLDTEFSGSISVALVMLALLGNSVYSLGSSLWPKLSWIKTWVVLMVIQWAFAALLMILSAANINWEAFFSLMFKIDNDSAWVILWTGIGILTLLNVLCWCIAWNRYKNVQIIQRFMTK